MRRSRVIPLVAALLLLGGCQVLFSECEAIQDESWCEEEAVVKCTSGGKDITKANEVTQVRACRAEGLSCVEHPHEYYVNRLRASCEG